MTLTPNRVLWRHRPHRGIIIGLGGRRVTRSAAREAGFEMPLNLYPSIFDSGSVPAGWTPAQGGMIKYPVRNKELLRYLRQLLPGRWQKVIKKGTPGEVHYFEHQSGQVADVKHLH